MKDSRVDIQIQFFTTFVQTFLTEIYKQIATSKPFYFHVLTHQEQRQRIDLILKPLLSKMVHPTQGTSHESPVEDAQDTRIVDAKAEEEDEEEQIASSASRASKASMIVSTQAHPPSSSAAHTQVPSVIIAIPSASKKQVRSSRHLSSAVVLPEPIRSAGHLPTEEKKRPPSVRPLPEAFEIRASASTKPAAPEIEKKSDLVVNILEKAPVPPAKIQSAKTVPVTLPEKVVSTKKPVAVITPMKIQSNAVHQTQRQVQSSTKRAQERIQSVRAVPALPIPTTKIKSAAQAQLGPASVAV